MSHDHGRVVLRDVFEALSALFVIISLLAVIYSEYPVLRALAGITLIGIVSAMTATLVHRYEHEDRDAGSGGGKPPSDII